MTWWRVVEVILEVIGAIALVGGGLGAIAACMLSSQISREEDRLPRLPVPESSPLEAQEARCERGTG